MILQTQTAIVPDVTPALPVQSPRNRLLRANAEAAIERLIALLDAIDGDADFEEQCEDEGAQCDDEGHDSDTELNGDEGDYSQCADDPAFLGWHGGDRVEQQRNDPVVLNMDKDGNVSFMKDGERWIGGRLTL